MPMLDLLRLFFFSSLARSATRPRFIGTLSADPLTCPFGLVSSSMCTSPSSGMTGSSAAKGTGVEVEATPRRDGGLAETGGFERGLTEMGLVEGGLPAREGSFADEGGAELSVK